MSNNINLLKLLSTKGFIQYSKTIAKKIGVYEAITLGELCSVANMFGFDEFYFSQEELAEDTGLSVKQIRNAVASLVNFNIVSVQKKGIPCKNWYTLNADSIAEILTCEEKNAQVVTPKVPCQIGKNGTTSSAKMEQHLKDITKDINKRYNYSSKEIQKDESSENELNFENLEKDSEFYPWENPNTSTTTLEEPQNLFHSSINNANEHEELSETTSPRETKTNNIVSETKPSSQRKPKERKTPPKERKGTFPKESYDEVYKIYFANRDFLFQKGNLATGSLGYQLNYNACNACIKRAFETYGVEKTIKAVKSSLAEYWLYQNGRDYTFLSIFSNTVLEKIVNRNDDFEQNIKPKIAQNQPQKQSAIAKTGFADASEYKSFDL